MYLGDDHIFSQLCQLQVSVLTDVGGGWKGCDGWYKISRICHVSCFLPGREQPAGNPPNETLQLLRGATKKPQPHTSPARFRPSSVCLAGLVSVRTSPLKPAVTCSPCEFEAARRLAAHPAVFDLHLEPLGSSRQRKEGAEAAREGRREKCPLLEGAKPHGRQSAGRGVRH